MTSRRVALVTGGTRGIGLGIARALASDGFDLVLAGLRQDDEVEDVLDSLARLVRVCYVQADVARSRDRLTLLQQARATFGALHVLVNNAGVAPRQRRDILEATEESFEEVLAVNLQGPYFLTQAAARWMIEQRHADPLWRGAIVNISSISAEVASTNRGEYCISKAGVAMATRLWAARLGEFGIPVYEVRPGVIRTDMTAGVEQMYERLFDAGLAVEGRWGTPEDVGRAVAALARGDFAYSPGLVVTVDGGITLPRL